MDNAVAEDSLKTSDSNIIANEMSNGSVQAMMPQANDRERLANGHPVDSDGPTSDTKSTEAKAKEEALPQRPRRVARTQLPHGTEEGRQGTLDTAQKPERLPAAAIEEWLGEAKAMAAMVLRPMPVSHATPAPKAEGVEASASGRNATSGGQRPGRAISQANGRTRPPGTKTNPSGASSAAAALRTSATGLGVQAPKPGANSSMPEGGAEGNPDADVSAAAAAATAATLSTLSLAVAAATREKPPPSARPEPSRKPATRTAPSAPSSRAPRQRAPTASKPAGRDTGVASRPTRAAGGDAAPATASSNSVSLHGLADAPAAVLAALKADNSKLQKDRTELSTQVADLTCQVSQLTEQHNLLAGELQRLLSQNTHLNTALASSVTTVETQAELVEILSEAVREKILVDDPVAVEEAVKEGRRDEAEGEGEGKVTVEEVQAAAA